MLDRLAPRLRAILKAELRFNGGASTVACIVRDVSDSGARIELAGDVPIPDRFDLHIAKLQQTRRASRRWKRGLDVGIVFEPLPEALVGSNEPTSDRISKLEAEMVELRQLLDQMRAQLSTTSSGATDEDTTGKVTMTA
jgi:hypothetical protein